MKISYKKLWVKLIEEDISKSSLRQKTGLSGGTMAKLAKHETVALSVLLSICEVLKCDIGDICAAKPDDESIEN
ncbi:MAG: helix-turn-helix transcriptional regulator [Clostridia bacterium]